MIQFYAPKIENSHFLPEDESAHCCRVLRMKEGGEIFVTDGKGNRFKARITKADPRHTEVEILEKQYSGTGRDYKIVLAVAPTKNFDRMEWLAEKATEIGVDSILLLGCERSERKSVRTDRLEKIVVSAMKQSLKTTRPHVGSMIPFREAAEMEFDGIKVMGYCDDIHERKLFTTYYKPGQNVMIFIGPEGDFSPSEVETAEMNEIVPVTFGNNRLRTETAGLYAIAAVHTLNGE